MTYQNELQVRTFVLVDIMLGTSNHASGIMRGLAWAAGCGPGFVGRLFYS